MLTLLVFLILLSILVLVHELGHFLAAKKMGVKVEEFGLGYPPRIWGKKIGETIYSLNALPFGGFVKLYGEEGGKNTSKQAFYNKSRLERSLIIVAGVAMNFLLGVIVISYLFSQGVYVPQPGVVIEKVLPNTPAQKAGLKENDVVESINGQKVNSPQELVQVTKNKLDETVVLLVQRCAGENNPNCQLLTFSLVPRKTYPATEGPMGIAIMPNLMLKTYPIWQAPFLGTIEAFKMSFLIIKGIGLMFWQLLTLSKVPQEVAGPIGIYKITGQAWQMGGFFGVWQLLGLLSLNLAVVNILPIPALDGGKLFLIGIETIVGKKRIVKIERTAQAIGLAIIMALIVLVTISDLSKLSFIQNLLQRIKLLF